MSLAPRLLGLAFAAADTLIEIDGQGVIRFALGAGPSGNQPVAHWVGTSLVDLLSADGAARVNALISDLPKGGRGKGITVEVDCGNGRYRKASLSVFRLPELAPALSCALTYSDEEIVLSAPMLPQRAIHDARDLQAHLRQRLGSENAHSLQGMALAFIDVLGMETVDTNQMTTVSDGIEAILQSASVDGNSAGRLTDNRYALVRHKSDNRDLDAEVTAIGQLHGLSLSTRTGTAPIGTEPAAALRALRFAIEACLREDGVDAPEKGFAETLARTLRDADRFRAIVRDKDFALFYQPIVDLKTRTVHHFEGLARFPNTAGPAAAIKMAEELALIEAFDLSVAEMAVRKLRSPGSSRLRMAINVSGASLSNDHYVTHLLALTAQDPAIRQRLLVEITETAALADLTSANRRLATLRTAGIKVCIDDFGAGSASFDYLRGLKVDIVKIDGSLVREVNVEGRALTLIGHLVDLCSALNIETVAEMVETEEQARILTELGVTHAQGWLFGKAEIEPQLNIHTPTISARRRGTVETWG